MYGWQQLLQICWTIKARVLQISHWQHRNRSEIEQKSRNRRTQEESSEDIMEQDMRLTKKTLILPLKKQTAWKIDLNAMLELPCIAPDRPTLPVSTKEPQRFRPRFYRQNEATSLIGSTSVLVIKLCIYLQRILHSPLYSTWGAPSFSQTFQSHIEPERPTTTFLQKPRR